MIHSHSASGYGSAGLVLFHGRWDSWEKAESVLSAAWVFSDDRLAAICAWLWRQGADGQAWRFHQLRHYFASSLLTDGVDIRALAEYLGHHSAAFTLATSTHLMPSAHNRMRKAIGVTLSADGPATAREAGNTRYLPSLRIIQSWYGGPLPAPGKRRTGPYAPQPGLTARVAI